MSERRVDPYTERAVLIAPHRRRHKLSGGRLPSPSHRCPFCPGHEAELEETLSIWPETGPWRAKIVRNRFPVVSPEFANGDHYVGIDSADHEADLATMSTASVFGALRLYRALTGSLESRPENRWVVWFRNRGRRAGSSEPHPHSQIVATRWIPSEVSLRDRIANAFAAAHGESLHGREVRRELAEGVRLLLQGDHFVLYCPRVPSRPYEMRISPLASDGPRFCDLSEEALMEFAATLVNATAGLARVIEGPSYNLVLRQPPTGPRSDWYLDILPRTGGDAGFELATGENIVLVGPERAAEELRAQR